MEAPCCCGRRKRGQGSWTGSWGRCLPNGLALLETFVESYDRPPKKLGREAAAILKRVLDHLTMVWPKVKITLRGDSHFSTPEVHDSCDGYGIDFITASNFDTIQLRVLKVGARVREQATKVRLHFATSYLKELMKTVVFINLLA